MKAMEYVENSEWELIDDAGTGRNGNIPNVLTRSSRNIWESSRHQLRSRRVTQLNDKSEVDQSQGSDE